jgi:hypothetical protein
VTPADSTAAKLHGTQRNRSCCWFGKAASYQELFRVCYPKLRPSSVEIYSFCMEDRVAMRTWKQWLAFNGTDLKLAALISALVFGTGLLMRWLPV